MDEFDQKHCFKCNQHNLLSKECILCRKIFCPEHLMCESHDCSEAWRLKNEKIPICPLCNQMIDDKANVSFPEGQKLQYIVAAHIESGCKRFLVKSGEKKICEVDGCNEKRMIRCKGCRKWMCLHHRHLEDHQCSTLKKQSINSKEEKSGWKLPLNPWLMRANAKRTTIKKEKEKNSYFENDPGNPVGQKSIEMQDRIYMAIFFPYRSKRKACYFFFSKNWSIGKVIDRISTHGNIKNQNAETTDPSSRLLLYALPSGIPLPFSDTIQSCINQKLLPSNGRMFAILEYGPSLDENIKKLASQVITGIGPHESESSECVIQ